MGSSNKRVNQIAEKNVTTSDDQSSSVVEQGLATTHEQVSDTYVEGTIDHKLTKSTNRK